MNRPYDAETTRAHILEMVEKYKTLPEPQTFTKGEQGAITGTINKFLNSDGKKQGDAKRHVILGWLFGDPEKILTPLSSSKLTQGQWYALHKWLGLAPMKLPDGKTQWLTNTEFQPELWAVMASAMKKYYEGQRQMEVLAGLEEPHG